MTLPPPPAGKVQELPFIVELLIRLDELPITLQGSPKVSATVLEGSSLVESFEYRDTFAFGVNVVTLIV